MKVTLIDFQEEKLDELREYCNDAQAEYGKRGKQQIISLTHWEPTALPPLPARISNILTKMSW